jgi:hypothetical protein
MTIFDAAAKVQARKACRWSSGRQRIRHRLQPRLGRQRRAAAGRAAVIAESYERIHRSNLAGMGVLPLQCNTRRNSTLLPASLGLTGNVCVEIGG